ncbi:MAG: SpoIID/LytB domain-containing protein [Thermoanaerobaculales bacterium]|nr:SpoIID/LytB domain-containing protein [Thermoanaerobaculales bacterium]
MATPQAPAAVVATPTPRPTPSPVPSPAPLAPPPAGVASGVAAEIGGEPIRVLLERTTDPVRLPQPGRAYRAEGGGEAVWLWGPVEIAVDGTTVWQAGAFSTAETAATAAASLGRALGATARVWTEPPSDGLVRLRVSWPSGEPADPGAALAAAGSSGAYRVPGKVTVRATGAAGRLEAGEIVLTPADLWPTVIGDRSYRGRFRARPGAGGMLLVNELEIEEYLRGVVPVEMGPYQFPELEALKAQAVAARTYAVAHLGDHDEEGWDICATPACQAYHGAGAEHPLSDRAVRETAGVVAVFGGVPIDAMYTSTCGGHTEDAAELFPDRAQPYLVGVACAWDRPMVLTGADGAGPWTDRVGFQAALAHRALGLSSGSGEAQVVEALRARTGARVHLLAPLDADAVAENLLAIAGIRGPAGPPPPARGLTRLLELADLAGIPLDPPLGEPAASGAAAAAAAGLAPGATARPSPAWVASAALVVLELRGDVGRDAGEAVPHPDGIAIYPRRADRSEPLPHPVPLWERWGDAYRRVASAEVLPGTGLERIRLGDRLLALVVVRSGGGAEADRRSAWRGWRRDRSWSELSASLGEPRLDGIEVVRRSASGRVVGLAVTDRDGGRRVITGFDVRRALDLPETLFEVDVTTRPDGERVAHFLGRGWGHGVGLCQNGAYGLARAGMVFEAILGHYYRGVELVQRRAR